MTISGFFFLCLIAGLVWAVISLLMSGGFSAEADADVSADGVSGEITFSPVSPTVIATFITAFGGGGIVATEGLKWGPLAAVAIACCSGFAISGLVYGVLNAVYKRTQGSSEAHAEDAIGVTAQVLTPIANDSVGEIAYVCRGSRLTGPARSIDNQSIGKNTLVEIIRIVGSTLYVRPVSGDSLDSKDQED